MRKKMLSNKELTMFCDHMSMVLKAGMTPAMGIDLMLSDIDSEGGKEILEPIAQKCNEGYSFSEAISSSGVFPHYACHMIEIGNASGKLEEVMDALVFHYEREASIAESIKSAVTYPFLIISMMIAVIIVLIVKVIPVFDKVFRQLGSEMTGVSGTLLKIGNTMTKYSVVFIIIFALLAIMFIFFTKTPWGKKAFTKFASSFVLTRGFYNRVAAARFASGMAMTMSAGLDTDESLELVEKLVDNKKMSEKINKARTLMTGDAQNPPVSFSNALSETSIFSNMYSKMISIGVSTGAVDSVLKKIAHSYDDEIEKSMDHTISILEPTLVIILSVIVCLILLSVILPLLGIMTGIS